MVIINDPQIAFELMGDRAAIHSSRPVQTFSGDMYVESQPPLLTRTRPHGLLTRHLELDGKMRLQ